MTTAMRSKICAVLYIPIFCLVLYLAACSKNDPTNGPAMKTAYSDRQKAGWVGPVRTVTEEKAGFTSGVHTKIRPWFPLPEWL